MDREALVAAFAQLWSVMAEQVEIGQRYVQLKQESEFMLGALIEAVAHADITPEQMDTALSEACSVAGLDPENVVVRVVKAELAQIEREHKIEAMRNQAAMN